MASIRYRVTGQLNGEQATKRFRNSDEGRKGATAFAKSLENPTKLYDVRARIGGREVTRTFTRRKDADSYATTLEADKLRGVVVDPRRANITVSDHSNRWLAGRPDLSERTTELYRWLLDRHILPMFGTRSMGSLSPSSVRSWHAGIAATHPTTAAKAYRLLRGIMNAAVSDEVISRNPCQVKGAGQEKAPERPVATIAEVQALSDAMPDEQRIAVLLAACCSLRRAELLGLRRRDIDPMRGTLTVEVTRTKSMAGTMLEKPPKTDAGRRTLRVPAKVLPALISHLEAFVGSDPDALLLDGGYRSLRTAWDNARRKVGVTYRLHDLRHFGQTMAAATGASTKELMHRAGHSSPAAALRYQHATEDRDQVLADALSELLPDAPVISITRAAAG